MLFDGADDAVTVSQGGRQWLLAENGFAGGSRLFDKIGVAIRLHGYNHGVNVRIIEHLISLGPEFHPKILRGLLSSFEVVIPGRYQFDIGEILHDPAVNIGMAVGMAKDTKANPFHTHLLHGS
jgi:hypothetical protein